MNTHLPVQATYRCRPVQGRGSTAVRQNGVSPTCAIGAVVLAIVVSLLALVSPACTASINVSTYGAKGDGVSDDTRAIQAAINAAASSKGTVTFSEGTYRITSTLYPRSDMTISGVPGRTTIAMPAQSSLTYMLYTENASNLTLSGLGFRAGGHTSNVSGLYLPGAKNCRADNLYFEGLSTGVKLGSGNVATGWEMSDITVRNTRMPMFISHVHDSTFTRLNLQAIHLPDTKLDHALYMERESRQLNFRDCTLSGGSGYSLQLWLGGGSSSDIAFSNLTVNASTGMYPVVIGPGFSNVYFNNTRLIARPSDEIVRFYGGTNVVFDGFSASGGDVLALVVREVNNVTFRNGTYTGSNLGSGVTLENVSTNTTIAPATTTAASTTTTTVAPTTVTTVPQQTQAI